MEIVHDTLIYAGPYKRASVLAMITCQVYLRFYNDMQKLWHKMQPLYAHACERLWIPCSQKLMLWYGSWSYTWQHLR